jgi:two-component system chemotaxis response regulator CheB
VRSVRDSATGSIPGSGPSGAARLGGLTMPRARELLAVGASTGGPPVVLEFIRTLPADLAMPVVITQHMPESHLPHFARLLADQSKRPVALGVDGELLAPGRFYVAPGGRHMLVVRDRAGLRIALDNGPEEHFCKPAVDPMFRSVAAACAGTAIGVVMTGMGSDGALGAVELRAAGIPVAVQDEASSIVWGMPGATFAAGAADAVVPGDQLARTVAAWMSPFPVAPRGTRS